MAVTRRPSNIPIPVCFYTQGLDTSSPTLILDSTFNVSAALLAPHDTKLFLLVDLDRTTEGRAYGIRGCTTSQYELIIRFQHLPYPARVLFPRSAIDSLSVANELVPYLIHVSRPPVIPRSWPQYFRIPGSQRSPAYRTVRAIPTDIAVARGAATTWLLPDVTRPYQAGDYLRIVDATSLYFVAAVRLQRVYALERDDVEFLGEVFPPHTSRAHTDLLRLQASSTSVQLDRSLREAYQMYRNDLHPIEDTPPF